MRQIILNYLFVFVAPLIFGFLIRFIGGSSKRAYFITLGLVGLAVIAQIIVWAVPANGSEQNALLAVQAACAAAASLLTGVVMSLQKKRSASK